MPAYTRTKYQADSGFVHAIRINPITVTLAGAAPVDPVDSEVRVKISKGNREFGIRPRRIKIGKTFGVAPNTFVRTAYIAVLTPATFAAATHQLNAVVTYKGDADWQVISRDPEDY